MADYITRDWIADTLAALLEPLGPERSDRVWVELVPVGGDLAFRLQLKKPAQITHFTSYHEPWTGWLSDTAHTVSVEFSRKCKDKFEEREGEDRPLTAMTGALVQVNELYVIFPDCDAELFRARYGTRSKEVGHSERSSSRAVTAHEEGSRNPEIAPELAPLRVIVEACKYIGSERSPVFGRPVEVRKHPRVKDLLQNLPRRAKATREPDSHAPVNSAKQSDRLAGTDDSDDSDTSSVGSIQSQLPRDSDDEEPQQLATQAPRTVRMSQLAPTHSVPVSAPWPTQLASSDPPTSVTCNKANTTMNITTVPADAPPVSSPPIERPAAPDVVRKPKSQSPSVHESPLDRPNSDSMEEVIHVRSSPVSSPLPQKAPSPPSQKAVAVEIPKTRRRRSTYDDLEFEGVTEITRHVRSSKERDSPSQETVHVHSTTGRSFNVKSILPHAESSTSRLDRPRTAGVRKKRKRLVVNMNWEETSESLPRHEALIPKRQQKILECSESWWPPLPESGHASVAYPPIPQIQPACEVSPRPFSLPPSTGPRTSIARTSLATAVAIPPRDPSVTYSQFSDPGSDSDPLAWSQSQTGIPSRGFGDFNDIPPDSSAASKAQSHPRRASLSRIIESPGRSQIPSQPRLGAMGRKKDPAPDQGGRRGSMTRSRNGIVKKRESDPKNSEAQPKKPRAARKSANRHMKSNAVSQEQSEPPETERTPSPEPPFLMVNPRGYTMVQKYGLLRSQDVMRWKEKELKKKKRRERGEPSESESDHEEDSWADDEDQGDEAESTQQSEAPPANPPPQDNTSSIVWTAASVAKHDANSVVSAPNPKVDDSLVEEDTWVSAEEQLDSQCQRDAPAKAIAKMKAEEQNVYPAPDHVDNQGIGEEPLSDLTGADEPMGYKRKDLIETENAGRIAHEDDNEEDDNIPVARLVPFNTQPQTQSTATPAPSKVQQIISQGYQKLAGILSPGNKSSHQSSSDALPSIEPATHTPVPREAIVQVAETPYGKTLAAADPLMPRVPSRVAQDEDHDMLDYGEDHVTDTQLQSSRTETSSGQQPPQSSTGAGTAIVRPPQREKTDKPATEVRKVEFPVIGPEKKNVVAPITPIPAKNPARRRKIKKQADFSTQEIRNTEDRDLQTIWKEQKRQFVETHHSPPSPQAPASSEATSRKRPQPIDLTAASNPTKSRKLDDSPGSNASMALEDTIDEPVHSQESPASFGHRPQISPLPARGNTHWGRGMATSPETDGSDNVIPAYPGTVDPSQPAVLWKPRVVRDAEERQRNLQYSSDIEPSPEARRRIPASETESEDRDYSLVRPDSTQESEPKVGVKRRNMASKQLDREGKRHASQKAQPTVVGQGIPDSEDEEMATQAVRREELDTDDEPEQPKAQHSEPRVSKAQRSKLQEVESPEVESRGETPQRTQQSGERPEDEEMVTPDDLEQPKIRRPGSQGSAVQIPKSQEVESQQVEYQEAISQVGSPQEVQSQEMRSQAATSFETESQPTESQVLPTEMYAGLRERSIKLPGYEKLSAEQKARLDDKRKAFFGNIEDNGGLFWGSSIQRPGTNTPNVSRSSSSHIEHHGAVGNSPDRWTTPGALPRYDQSSAGGEADTWYQDENTPLKLYLRRFKSLKQVRHEMSTGRGGE